MIQLPSRYDAPTMPHVTVVVPCYNYGHFLESCVMSIITQKGVTTSVHIIDDASPDNSFKQAQALAKRFDNVHAERNDQNLGHIATYNKGLSQVESEYVVLLSADDMLAPGALQRATTVMEKHPDVGLVYGHPQTFETSPRGNKARFVTWSIWDGQEWINKQFKRGLSIIYSPEAVVRTAVHHRVGYYRPELPHSGDLELWLRIADISKVARVNGADQAYRRTHPQSMMNTDFSGILTDLTERQKAYESYLNSSNSGLRLRRRREGIMRKRLAEEALDWASDEAIRNTDENSARSGVDFAISVYSDCQRLAAWETATVDSIGGIRQSLLRGRRLIVDKFRWRMWRYFGT